jgi:hypothetical protein
MVHNIKIISRVDLIWIVININKIIQWEIEIGIWSLILHHRTFIRHLNLLKMLIKIKINWLLISKVIGVRKVLFRSWILEALAKKISIFMKHKKIMIHRWIQKKKMKCKKYCKNHKDKVIMNEINHNFNCNNLIMNIISKIKQIKFSNSNKITLFF